MSFEKNALPELSAEKKEQIKLIEGLLLQNQTKAEIILVLLGEKPSTNAELNEFLDESPSELKEALESIGLSCLLNKERYQERIAEVVKNRDDDDSSGQHVTFPVAIARDRATAEQLAKLEWARDDEAFGRMMGYPETAIQAFVADVKEESPGAHTVRLNFMPNLDARTLGLVFQIALSQEHYEEEIKVLKRWSDVIRKYCPTLYSKLQNPSL